MIKYLRREDYEAVRGIYGRVVEEIGGECEFGEFPFGRELEEGRRRRRREMGGEGGGGIGGDVIDGGRNGNKSE